MSPSKKLQWGRTDEGAETFDGRSLVYWAYQLQWGRTDEGAETYRI